MNHRWNDQEDAILNAFYQSTAWDKARKAYFNIKFARCERCDELLGIKPRDHSVHHIIELTPDNVNDPMISLSFDNFELLCQSCHNKHHKSSGSATTEETEFDEFGNVTFDTSGETWRNS